MSASSVVAFNSVKINPPIDHTVLNHCEDCRHKQEAIPASTWYGRTISTMKDSLQSIFLRIAHAAQSVLFTLGFLTTDANALANIFRRLNGQVFNAVDQLSSIPGFFNKFRAASGSAVGWIDTLQLFSDVNYLYSGKYKSDSNVGIAAKISIFAADIGGSLLWLQEISLLNLSKAAATLGQTRFFGFVPKIVSCLPLIRDVSGIQRLASAIGEIRVFGFVNQISMKFIAGRALALAYILFAVDSSKKLLDANNTVTQRTQAGIDLSRYLSELALDAMLILGVTNVIGLGVMGAVCITTGVASLAYRVNHK